MAEIGVEPDRITPSRLLAVYRLVCINFLSAPRHSVSHRRRALWPSSASQVGVR